MAVCLVSACLLGVNCKYNNTSNKNSEILKLLNKERLIPVCPEQLGGLPSPREPSEQKEGRVYSKSGKDVTDAFVKGAYETYKIAEIYGARKAIFKERSPSCGVTKIYDGTFSQKVIDGAGITTSFLRKHAIEVISEEASGFL